jgi:hypothetical protein
MAKKPPLKSPSPPPTEGLKDKVAKQRDTRGGAGYTGPYREPKGPSGPPFPHQPPEKKK